MMELSERGVHSASLVLFSNVIRPTDVSDVSNHVTCCRRREDHILRNQMLDFHLAGDKTVAKIHI